MATKGPSKRMKGLLGEFKKLYEDRLAKLKTSDTSSDLPTDKESLLINYEV